MSEGQQFVMSKGFKLALAEHAVRLLNEVLKADPEAVNQLLSHVPHNGSLKDHPTVQVGSLRPDGSPGMFLSWLGILNGIIGTQPGTSWGYVCAEVDLKTRRIQNFCIAIPPGEEAVQAPPVELDPTQS